MRIVTRGMIAALALAALLGLAATAEAKPPRSFFGVMPQGFLGDDDFERMDRANVGTLRFDLNWSSIDSAAPAGDYDWSGVDRLVGEAAKAGVTTLPYAFTTPTWVAKDLDRSNCPKRRCAIYAPRSKQARAAWREFIAAAARRYGRGGEFWAQNPAIPKRPIKVWQIWNEQNSPSFYRPSPNPRAYAKLLSSAETALRGVDRRAKVVVGGMFGTPLGGRKPGITSWEFIERLYKVGGARKDFDGVGVHPYAAQVSKARSQIARVRRALREARDPSASLWITELGWASSGPNNPLVRGPRGQAERLRQSFEMLAKKRRSWNVEGVIWYSWRDSETSVCEWCAGSGLLSKNGRAKRSLRSFTKFTNGR